MAFTLDNLGIKIYRPKTDKKDEYLINQCLNIINNQQANFQILLNQKIKLDLLQEKLKNNFMEKKNKFIKKLSPNNFNKNTSDLINNYFKGVNNIGNLLDIDKKEFFDYNLLIFKTNILKNYKFYEILEEVNIEKPDIELLNKIKLIDGNFLHEFFIQTKHCILNKINDTIFIGEYPQHLKDFYKLNLLIKNFKKFNNTFYQLNMSHKKIAKNYIDTFTDNIIVHLDKIINNNKKFTLKVLNNVMYDFINVIKQSDNKFKINNISNFTEKIKTILELKLSTILNRETLIDFLNIYKNQPLLQESIRTIFKSYQDNDVFKDIVKTLTRLENELIPIFMDSITFINETVIRIKYYLSEKIGNISEDELQKIEIFNNIYCCEYCENNSDQNYKIIKMMLDDIKQSKKISNIIKPNNLYHFTMGIWDFPMDNNYFSVEDGNKYQMIPFREEINVINVLNENCKKDNLLFSTKGKITMELSDENHKLTCDFLPIQAFVIQYLLNKNKITNKNLQKLCIEANVKNYLQVIKTLSDLVVKRKYTYYLIKKLPKYNYKNYAELYFSENAKIIENKINDEITMSLKEILESNIISIVKKQENNTIEKNNLVKLLNDHIKVINFTNNDINNCIDNLVKRDYLIKTENIITYQV